VQKMLDFWQSDKGHGYNQKRFDAVNSVVLQNNLDAVKRSIEEKEGKKPLVIVTSAKSLQSDKTITFYDQAKVWALDRPILFVFGTGQGLSEAVMEQADFVLLPIEGFSDYNHLSVRSAAAIIFDRWFGINSKKIA